jgi:phosphatidylserine/phosphatidylglycerophosphate/cardiolipin synthase-like enzyme
VPLKRAGVRIGLHAKSIVIDEQIGVVGSHNFDPRSTDYNTESLVVVHDAGFAQALAASIRRDMEPQNAWTIAPRTRLPVLSTINYNLGKWSEKLPIFDLWPFPYATSYELKPGCQPLSPDDPGFDACYQWVGDFPEVNLSLKSVYTRIITVFGAGLVPIL